MSEIGFQAFTDVPGSVPLRNARIMNETGVTLMCPVDLDSNGIAIFKEGIRIAVDQTVELRFTADLVCPDPSPTWVQVAWLRDAFPADGEVVPAVDIQGYQHTIVLDRSPSGDLFLSRPLPAAPGVTIICANWRGRIEA